MKKWLLILAVLLCGCRHGALHVDVDREAYPVKGIDLSAHNGDVDFVQVAADTVTFVLLKATEGTDFCDARFATNLARAKDAGLKVGAYHFFRFDSPGHLQAYHFMRTVGNADLDLPMAIDVEEWQNATGVPYAEVSAQLAEMVEVLQAAGRRVMIYSNRKGYAQYVLPAAASDMQLWISSPSAEPQVPGWTLWQHSQEGAIRGIDGLVDINTFNGTADEFELWLLPDSMKPVLTIETYD